MSDSNDQVHLFSPYKHTVKLAIVGGENEEPDQEKEWADLDIYSNHQDTRTALMSYLRAEYGDTTEISESRDGIFRVPEPGLEDGVLTRYYKLR